MTSMSNPLKMLTQDNTVDTTKTIRFLREQKCSSNQRLIEVFVFGTRKKIRKDLLRKTELCLPTTQQVQLDFEKPIFTDKDQALNYGRFLPNIYCIVKVHIFDLAIECKDNQLYLRNNYLQNDMIHGFHPSTVDLRLYIKNPEFNIALLKTQTIVLC